MTELSQVWSSVCRVRERGPLVHNITNFVVMNTTANALLAVGASPIMAHAPEEMADLVGIVDALVLNIGTLSRPWLDSMQCAGEQALSRGIPVVLDPVGAGASRLRTQAARELTEQVRPAVLRGNASEILVLADALGVHPAGAEEGATKGVDSTQETLAAAPVAMALARQTGAVVCVSGEKDVITDGEAQCIVHGGHALMPRVTGLGCTATSLVGAYAALGGTPLEAAVDAMAVMSTAGSMAAQRAEGPGTMQVHFLDALYTLTEADLSAHVRLEWA
ncbi:hydroxyethylthiazole kinase [Desulfobaculum senezii]|jgi:hydroxyethylthiazole kinase